MYLEELSFSLSMLGNIYGFLGHVRFRYVKSIHIFHLWDDFQTIIIFSNQVGYLIYVMKHASFSFLTYLSIVTLFLLVDLALLLYTRFIVELMARKWNTTLVSIKGILGGPRWIGRGSFWARQSSLHICHPLEIYSFFLEFLWANMDLLHLISESDSLPIRLYPRI